MILHLSYFVSLEISLLIVADKLLYDVMHLTKMGIGILPSIIPAVAGRDRECLHRELSMHNACRVLVVLCL